MKINVAVFLAVCAVSLFIGGYATGQYAERRMKDAACVAIPPMRQQSLDMDKKQERRWIKYYLSKGQ